MEIGFDTKKYLEAQTEAILDRIKKFNKLYLEFGGKFCHDFHAARVLPGYDCNTKIKLLQSLKKNIDILFCINAKDIQDGKVMGDFGITYDNATVKLINDLRNFGLDVTAVIINRFNEQTAANKFRHYLKNLGIKTYTQPEIQGYPTDINKIVSDNGFGKNPYIKTEKPIVIVTGAGPGSGKMSTCLSQLYYDRKNGLESGFAKFETFPVWGLPLDHPVNIAYEAATADIGDINMVDPFHLKAYNKIAINYNRDIENFNIMQGILNKIVGKNSLNYNSPTDMCVNMTKTGIINNKIVEEAAKQEIMRRYFRYKKEALRGIVSTKTVNRIEKLMLILKLKPIDRKVVEPAREAAAQAKVSGKGHKGFFCGAAIQLADSTIVAGKNSSLLHAESAAILNALKNLAKIPDKIDLLPLGILKQITALKAAITKSYSESLNVEELLITLSISVTTNPTAELAMSKLKELKGCEMHVTHLPSQGDEAGLRNLQINLTTDSLLIPD